MATSSDAMLSDPQLSSLSAEQIEQRRKIIKDFLAQKMTESQLLGYGFVKEEIANAQKQSDAPVVVQSAVQSVQADLPHDDPVSDLFLVSESDLQPQPQLQSQLQSQVVEDEQAEALAEQLRGALSKLAAGKGGIPLVEADDDDDFEKIPSTTVGKPLVFSSESSVEEAFVMVGQGEAAQNKEEGGEKVEAPQQKSAKWFGIW